MRAIREMLSSLWPDVLRRGPSDQDSQSWANVVKSYLELPAAYKEFFDALPDEERTPFPYTVLTPTFKGHRKPENEQLVCQIGGNVWVLEKIGDGLSTARFPLAEICFLENGMILLHSWITIRGVNADGVVTSATLKFNSVTDHVMAPLVECMRPPLTRAAAHGASSDSSRFNSLARKSFKFRSYADASIRAGETVVQTIMQPEICSEFFRFWVASRSKSVARAHLTILTDRELIDIRDDIGQRWLKGSPHGGIWTYIPLNKITSVSLAGMEEDLLVLSVRLPGNQHFDSVFQASARGELELLVKHCDGSSSLAIRN